MAEFDNDGRPTPATNAAGKKVAPFFAASRARGMINASMDTLARAFEEHNKEKGLGTKWEYYNPKISGGEDLVMYRQGSGWEIVTWDRMPNQPASAQLTGMVRRGDLVLMCAPWDLIKDELKQDAETAHTDMKASENAYKSTLDQNKVIRPSDQVTDQAVGTGQIKVATQVVMPPQEQGA